MNCSHIHNLHCSKGSLLLLVVTNVYPRPVFSHVCSTVLMLYTCAITYLRIVAIMEWQCSVGMRIYTVVVSGINAARCTR